MTFNLRWLVQEAEDAPILRFFKRGAFSRNGKGRLRAWGDHHACGWSDSHRRHSHGYLR